MLDISEVGSVPTQAEQTTVFTERRINYLGVIEGEAVHITYTDCSNAGDVQKEVVIPFEKFKSQLEATINGLIQNQNEANSKR